MATLTNDPDFINLTYLAAICCIESYLIKSHRFLDLTGHIDHPFRMRELRDTDCVDVKGVVTKARIQLLFQG